jgi:hypothetical protein
LVEGQLVCTRCAPKLRRRTIASLATFLGLAGLMFAFGWGPFVGVIERFGFVDGLLGVTGWGWLMLGLPPVVVLASADWSLRRMRRDNALALEALARARLLTDSAIESPPSPPRLEGD